MLGVFGNRTADPTVRHVEVQDCEQWQVIEIMDE